MRPYPLVRETEEIAHAGLLLHQQMPKDRRGAGTLPHFPEFWEFTGARCLFISTYIKMYTAHQILVSSSQIVFLLMQDHLHLPSFGLRKCFLVSACCSEIDLPYFPVNNCSQVYCLLVFPAEMLTPCQPLGAVVSFFLLACILELMGRPCYLVLLQNFDHMIWFYYIVALF